MSKTIQYKVQVDTGNSAKTLGQLESELAQINEELQDVSIGSDRFKELSTSAQQVTRELEQVNNEIEGFTAEKKFQAADGAIKLAAGSLQSFVGGLGLLGIESEALGEFEQKAASAIAVGIGFKDISEGIGQLGPIFKQSGIAAKLFGSTTKKAIIATGIGVFVVALGTVVAYWDDITKGIQNFAQKVPFVGKAIQAIKDGFNAIVDAFRPVLEFLGILPDETERANQAVIASNQEVINSTEREIALLQAKGATQKEIFEAQQKQLQAELDNLKRNEAEKEEIYKKETELLVLQAKEEKRLADEKAKAEEIKTQKLKEEAQKRKEAREKEQAEEEARIQKEKEKAEKEAQEAADRETKRLETIASILESYRLKQEEIDAKTEIDKINLEEQRKLEELERLKATEEEKQAIRDFYKLRREEQELVEKEEADAKLAEQRQTELDELAALEQQKLDLKKQSLDTLSQLFGQETALGKAALLAKQAILAQELILNVQSTLSKAKEVATNASLDAAGSTSAIAAGTAKTAAVGFPQNIPLLIGYAAQAVGIISAVKSAVGKAKSISSGLGGSVGGTSIGNVSVPTGGATPPVTPTASTPLQNTLTAQSAQEERNGNQPIKAYVVSGDVSSAQEAESKIRMRRRVGG